MIAPLPLCPGDKIGLIAPSRKISSADLNEAVRLIERWGYQTIFGKNLFQSQHQFAGSDEERTKDFLQMIEDPDVKAILAVRGGYGTVRILEKLSPDIIRRNPKWIIGYSDITVLHSYFNQVIGCETIHASMPVNCNAETAQSETWLKLLQTLQGLPISYEIPAHELNRNGKATGMVVGGNLSVLFSLRGTFCDIDLDGKILFLEDLDEYLYHIDRMMMNLKIAGKLEHLKGLVVGGMTEMKDNMTPFGKSAYEIIAEAVCGYNYPVVYGFPAGHCEPNLPLILGRAAQLEVTKGKTTLNFFHRNIP